jgi:hypothetical protein
MNIYSCKLISFELPKTKKAQAELLSTWLGLDLEIFAQLTGEDIYHPFCSSRHMVRFLVTKKLADYIVPYPDNLELKPNDPIAQSIFTINTCIQVKFSKPELIVKISALLNNLRQNHPEILEFIKSKLDSYFHGYFPSVQD